MKQEKKICVLCKKEIGDKEKMYKIILINNGNEEANDYVHYSCWHNAFNPETYLKQAMNIVSPIINRVMGKEEVIEIK